MKSGQRLNFFGYILEYAPRLREYLGYLNIYANIRNFTGSKKEGYLLSINTVLLIGILQPIHIRHRDLNRCELHHY